MLRSTFVMLIAFLFMAASPALAVKKVPKQSAQRSTAQDQGQNQTSGQQRAGEAEKVGQPAPPPEPQPRRPEPQKIKEKDRFIDENDDGINDRYRKPPAVKKKPKKEESNQTSRVRRSRRPR